MTEYFNAPAGETNKLAPLFSGDSLAKVAEIPITETDVKRFAITDENHDKIVSLRARMVETHAKMTEDDEATNRKLLKSMIDDGFASLFDQETAEKAYELSGREVMGYTTAYVRVLDFIGSQFEQRANSEVFAKYAPQIKQGQ